MGYVTKLPVREEKKSIEGGVNRLLLRTELDRQDKWHYLKRKPHARTEAAHVSFKPMITPELWNALSKLDRHTFDAIHTRITQILDEPLKRGKEKHGAFKGFKTVKFENQSYVLMFAVDEANRTVRFVRYSHHNVAYNSVPDLGKMEFVELAVLLTQRK